MSALSRLAELAGIAPSYLDYWGRERVVSDETKRALLSAMGYAAGTEAEAASTLAERERAGRARVIAPASVLRVDAPPLVRCALPDGSRVRWSVVLENGEEFDGDAACADGSFSVDAFSPGYHRLSAWYDGGATGAALIVAPAHAYVQPKLDGGRAWALSTQLYALRSERNWGIGDFTDLRELARQVQQAGGDAVAVNPLHELHPHNPSASSPYAASSRFFLNPLYVDVEAVPDFADAPDVREAVRAPEFVRRLRGLRGAPLVDYAGVAAAKRAIFERLYETFRRYQLEPNSARARAFEAFVAGGGRSLQRLARYQTLAEHFHSLDPHAYGWQQWPATYRSPESPEVEAFARERSDRVEFFLYLQWIADEQLAGVAASGDAMACGLYRDLAVGVDLNGADAWSDQACVLSAVSIGAPPDPLNALGQNWGLPPFSPAALRERGYEPFARLLRANMRYAGVLRVDHVMSLGRCYWIPRGAAASEGAYVAYDLDEMLGIVALESTRNRCTVVGEDLGTVPPVLTERMRHHRVFSTRLLYFQRDWNTGTFLPPNAYPRWAATSVATHDLPPLAGWWTGDDIAVRLRANLYPDDGALREASEDRFAARFELVDALLESGSLDEAGAERLREDARRSGSAEGAALLTVAVHRFLARTPSALLVAQIEDLLGEVDGVNLPGTVDEHPNWCRKRSATLEEIARSDLLTALGATLATQEVPT